MGRRYSDYQVDVFHVLALHTTPLKFYLLYFHLLLTSPLAAKVFDEDEAAIGVDRRGVKQMYSTCALGHNSRWDLQAGRRTRTAVARSRFCWRG